MLLNTQAMRVFRGANVMLENWRQVTVQYRILRIAEEGRFVLIFICKPI